MNPGDKGWLRIFLLYHERRLREGGETLFRRLAEEESDSYKYLYRLLQPTGLMYGYPVTFIHEPHPRAHEWGEREKIKVLLAEAYLGAGLYYFYRQSGSMRDSHRELLPQLREFHLQSSNRFKVSKSNRIGRRKLLVDQVEYMLDKRVDFSYDWRNFWNSFFHNTLLFFDLILFNQWLENSTLLVKEKLSQLLIELRLEVLKVIAAAAHADSEISAEENELFQHFLASAHLPAPQKRLAQRFIKEGVQLDDLNFKAFPTWLLRKYFLELAILTSWSNRQISQVEEAFLGQLTQKLELSEKDLEHSTQMVTQFVLTHWQQVHYLHIKQNYRIITEQLILRLRLLVKRNQRMISQEIQESRELVSLLRQSTQRELSESEWEKVREQLLDILRTIPAFTIFMLPLGSITLPILLRIIPKSILIPSSFRQNEFNEKLWEASTGPRGVFLWNPNHEKEEKEKAKQERKQRKKNSRKKKPKQKPTGDSGSPPVNE